MLINFRSINWLKIVDKLVVDNCLTMGQNPKLTNKKFTKYLLGTRSYFEIFKLYELRHLLLTVYPLISSLFYNTRRSHDARYWSFPIRKRNPRWLKRKLNKFAKMQEKSFHTSEMYPNLPPQILFASVTSAYAQIIESAAKMCNMSWHKNRWLNGAITAATSYNYDKQKWSFNFHLWHTDIKAHFNERFIINKENNEGVKEKMVYHTSSKWPSLIVIPDVINNFMIVNETKKIGLPVIGFVNSSCQLNIDYPIFARDVSIYFVYFFCHFLAKMIAKEMVQIQHKLFTARQPGFLKKATLRLRKKVAFRKPPKIFSLDKFIIEKKYRLYRRIKKKIKKPRTYRERFKNHFKQGYRFNVTTVLKFLKNKKYIFFIVNVLLKRLKVSLNVTTKKLIFFERQKKNVLAKKKLFWTDMEQRAALLQYYINFKDFERILRIQWSQKGRLWFNSEDSNYYWTPLIMLTQTPYKIGLHRLLNVRWKYITGYKKSFRFRIFKQRWKKKKHKYHA